MDLQDLLAKLIDAKYSNMDYANAFAQQLIEGVEDHHSPPTQKPILAWGWAGTWREFLHLSERNWLERLLLHRQKRWNDALVHKAQLSAWRAEYVFFRGLLSALVEVLPNTAESLITFEYEIPFEDGTRPDVILVLPSGHLVVIECKNRAEPEARDWAQLKEYRYSLARYHSTSLNLEIHSVLLLMKPTTVQGALTELPSGVRLARATTESPSDLESFLSSLLAPYTNRIEPLRWLEGQFVPHPKLVNSFVKAVKASEEVQVGGSATLEVESKEVEIRTWLSSRIADAQTESLHLLVIASAGPRSNRLGLRSVAEQLSRGRSVL